MKISLSLALGLLLLLEGTLPLLFPRQWRDTWQHIAEYSDGQIRFLGLVLWGGGLLILLLIFLFD